jgi:hypothetical protein
MSDERMSSVTAERLIMQTQADMCRHMAATDKHLTRITEVITDGQVRQGKLEEKLISLAEDSKRRDAEAAAFNTRISNLERKVGINEFARTSIPQIVMAIIGACGVTASAVYMVAKQTTSTVGGG